MKDEIAGGSAAESQLRERLARHFSEELGRAETDYRERREPEWVDVERLQPRRRMKLRLAAEGLAVVVLLVIGMVVYGQARTPATPAGPLSVVRGADGIPTQVDGQRVYRLSEKAEWQNLSGSFLLTGYVIGNGMFCPSQMSTPPPPEADLYDPCNGLELASKPLVEGPNPTADNVSVAPRGSDPIMSWADGTPIVVRVHAHDAEAAQCAENDQAQCRAAIVVEAVVWPFLPTEIGGQRVYRQLDSGSFPTSGSFLLGGRFSKPDVAPHCPAPIGKSEAEQQLIPYCFIQSIGGLQIAPMSNIDERKNEIVVARVHIHDVLAAQCPAGVRAECEGAIVVEAVVWRSDDLITASPSAGASPSLPSGIPAPTEATGPSTPPPTVAPPPPAQ